MSTKIEATYLSQKVIDLLTQYHNNEVLDANTFRRISEPRLLLDAINEADIELSLALKIPRTVIVFLPRDAKFVDLTNYDINVGDHITGILSEVTDPLQQVFFINNEPWAGIEQIKSQKVEVFDSYPAVATTSSNYFTLLGYEAFNSDQACEGCYYDPALSQLFVKRSTSKNRYLRFKAVVRAEKIPIDDLSNTEISDYRIITPSYAFKALLYQSVCELLTPGTELYNSLMNIAAIEKQKAARRHTYNPAILKVEPRF